jgi:hypothetical protein
MRATAIGAVLALMVVQVAAGQSEGDLRRYFEGRTVVVKLDLPGTDDGVDVYPGTSQPIDFPKHAGRLKKFGTAIRRGDEALITKLRVKKDLIEFQLDGGGYGTFGDDTDPNVSVPTVSKSERERNLEKDLERAKDPAAKRKIKEELDQLRRDRERENDRLRAQAESARQLKEANIHQRRLEGGSRFNLRYRGGVPDGEATPDAVMRALAEYLDFSPVLAARSERPGLDRPGDRSQLRKGLLVDEVDAILGRPDSISRREEGSLTVSTSVYLTADSRIEAEFVEGVLIRFVISSR